MFRCPNPCRNTAKAAPINGGLFVDISYFSTNSAGQTLTFDFSAPGLSIQAVGGNFFATDFAFNPMPTLVAVQLDDGTSYVNLMTLESSFVGFVSKGVAINSVSLSLPVAADLFPTVDRMLLSDLPVPGVIALLGVAGFVGLRRRGS